MRVVEVSQRTGLSMTEVARLVVEGTLRATVRANSKPSPLTVDVLDADVLKWVGERDVFVRSFADQAQCAQVLGRRFSLRGWPPGCDEKEPSHADQVLSVVAAMGDRGCSTGVIAQRLRRKWVNAATIKAAVGVLVERGLVSAATRRPQGRGRPSVVVSVTDEGLREVAGRRQSGVNRARAKVVSP